jgi:hypothetical protein
MQDQDPIFVSVKEAARILGLSTWAIYQKLDQQVIASRYDGRKRLVVMESLRNYAAGLPEVAPVKDAAVS